MTEKINKTINDLIDAIENLLKTQNKYVFYGILAMVFIAGLSIGFDHLKFNRWFDKKVVKNPDIRVYKDYEQESINFQEWAMNYKKGFILNKSYVVKTCTAINNNKYDFEFNYRPYCKMVGIDIN